EYIMTGLRTMWGVSLKKIETEYGLKIKEQLIENTTELVKSDFLVIEDHYIKITPTGKFLSDGIASKLFLV
ncbi:MAG: coproporphyrinogen III oxidase, partial [Flavobacteriaceae bacterium]|nr:coproporphyrinogen III oxidase [Flavobacteriaceae bacterium]